jgi:hypothetical protein
MIIIALLAEGQGILKLFRSAVTVIVTPISPPPPPSPHAHTPQLKPILRPIFSVKTSFMSIKTDSRGFNMNERTSNAAKFQENARSSENN